MSTSCRGVTFVQGRDMLSYRHVESYGPPGCPFTRLGMAPATRSKAAKLPSVIHYLIVRKKKKVKIDLVLIWIRNRSPFSLFFFFFSPFFPHFFHIDR